MTAVTRYAVVLSLQIAAVLAASGLLLAYPILLPYVRRNHPAAMPGIHDVQHRPAPYHTCATQSDLPSTAP
jgi:hypothetical protein